MSVGEIIYRIIMIFILSLAIVLIMVGEYNRYKRLTSLKDDYRPKVANIIVVILDLFCLALQIGCLCK